MKTENYIKSRCGTAHCFKCAKKESCFTSPLTVVDGLFFASVCSYSSGIVRAVYVHQGRQNIQHQYRIQKPNQPNARPDAGRSAQTGNHRRIAHECDTDARRQDAEGDEVRQRVDLDAELALQLRPVLLAAGNAAVECVKQAAQQQKQRPQHRMPRPTQGDEDPRYK